LPPVDGGVRRRLASTVEIEGQVRSALVAKTISLVDG
jgi:hypothetical protein